MNENLFNDWARLEFITLFGVVIVAFCLYLSAFVLNEVALILRKVNWVMIFALTFAAVMWSYLVYLIYQNWPAFSRVFFS